MSRTVYLNGQFVPESALKISAYDLSVAQGVAAFEMTRSFNGQHFKLKEHVVRLWESCRLLGIEVPDECVRLADIEDIIDHVTRLNDHGPGEEHRLLIVVSPGCAPMYRDLDGVLAHPFIYIADFPLSLTTRGKSKWLTDGIHATIPNVRVPSDHCVPSRAKHRARYHFHAAQEESERLGGDLAVMLDERGYVSECAGANIIVLRKQERVALTPDGPCLHGISLQTVCDLLQKDDWEIRRVASMTPGVLYESDEVWATATPFCIAPITQISTQVIGDGVPGEIFAWTLSQWSHMVGVNIQRQIEDWDAVRA